MDLSTLLIIVIALAIIFDYINGFHDAANSIATVVSTKALPPFLAVMWAALFNFAAYFYFTDHKVAQTVAQTVIEEYITLEVILAGLSAAILWNLITWYYGIPSSSSHTLIGGLAGAGMAYAFILGDNPIKAVSMTSTLKIIPFIFLAPVIGMTISIIVTLIVKNIARNLRPSKADKIFRSIQLFTSALLSFTHGGNDAQKVMGIIFIALVAGGKLQANDAMPEWIPLACYTAIALGTMSGGWRIIKTMGGKITKINPLEGVSSETASAVTLGLTEHFGIPVSTTHTITGSIIGVGLVKRVSAVRWGVTIQLLWAWVLTVPISALLGGGVLYLVHYLF